MLVHHGNQLLVTDGYGHRDGITAVAEATAELIRLHERLGLVASLHLSGTLLEALAWHRPDVLDLVRGATGSGLLEAVGGAYGEPVLPLLSAAARRRHLRVTAEVMGRLLDQGAPCSAWVPERVWHPELAGELMGAGYRAVALDDRLLLAGAARDKFDAAGPWHTRPSQLEPSLCRPVLDADSGLLVAPITAALRYLIPPRSDADLELLDALLDELPDGAVLTYADDLERTCGVAGWEPAFDRYTHFAAWAVGRSDLQILQLGQLEASERVRVQPGTYYELAHHHGAGEQYQHWADDPRWQPYAALLADVESDLDDAPAAPRLVELAERLLLVGQHETAWQDPTSDGNRGPAPWARATAAHARDAWPVLHAARWAAAGGCPPSAVRLDVDQDGAEEVVLADSRMWVAISPRHGGRSSLVVVRDHDVLDGRVIVGNPLNHWNFQEQSHQFMQQPPAHPGALAAHDQEGLDWKVVDLEADDGAARLVLASEGQSRHLLVHNGQLAMCWQGPAGTVESLLSPDYLALLEHGSRRIRHDSGPGWASVTHDGAQTWTAWRSGAATPARYGLAGHGAALAVTSTEQHLDLLIGTGPINTDLALTKLQQVGPLLHGPALIGPPGR